MALLPISFQIILLPFMHLSILCIPLHKKNNSLLQNFLPLLFFLFVFKTINTGNLKLKVYIATDECREERKEQVALLFPPSQLPDLICFPPTIPRWIPNVSPVLGYEQLELGPQQVSSSFSWNHMLIFQIWNLKGKAINSKWNLQIISFLMVLERNKNHETFLDTFIQSSHFRLIYPTNN